MSLLKEFENWTVKTENGTTSIIPPSAPEEGEGDDRPHTTTAATREGSERDRSPLKFAGERMVRPVRSAISGPLVLGGGGSAPARRKKNVGKVRFDDQAPLAKPDGGDNAGSSTPPGESAAAAGVAADGPQSLGAEGDSVNPENIAASLLGKKGKSKWQVVKRSLSDLADKTKGGREPGDDVTEGEPAGDASSARTRRELAADVANLPNFGGGSLSGVASSAPLAPPVKEKSSSGPLKTPNRAKMARQSVILCMDPMCNRCPPEMHAHMRQMMGQAKAKPSKPKYTLADLISDEDDEEEAKEKDEWMTVTIRCCGLTFTYRRRMNYWHNFLGGFQLPLFNPHNKYVKMWTRLLLIVSFVSFVVDPLFLFAVSFNQETYCAYTKWSYLWTLMGVRTFIDCFNLANMVLHTRLAFNATQAHVRKGIKNVWGENVKVGELVIDDERAILYNYLQTFFVWDILAILPLPQVVYLAILPNFSLASLQDTWQVVVRLITLVQFIPRFFRALPVVSGTGGYQLFDSAWSSFILNLFTFSMASHVVGAVWFVLTEQRVSYCFNTVCSSSTAGCQESFLNCPYNSPPSSPAQITWINSGEGLLCYNGSSPVPLGMYVNGVQSVYLDNWFNQWLYTLMWGFQQISTFAGNLVSTTTYGEVLFMFFIIALGLFLFALLIGNMQNFLQALSRRTMEHQLRMRDVEKWMEQRDIPRDIQKRVRNLERYTWTVTQGVKEEEVLQGLTEDIQRDLRRHLSLELIKKCHLFSVMDDMVQDAICERLRNRLYIRGTVIIREGSPVKRMFFVLRGALESSTTNKGRTGFFESVILGKGDFFGEELLIYFIEKYAGDARRTKFRKSLRRDVSVNSLLPEMLPKSERTVACLDPVDAFVLEAEDIEFVCTQFFKVMQSDKVQRALDVCSINRRFRAATTIQVWWRSLLRRRLEIPLEVMRHAIRTKRIGALLRNARASEAGESPDAVSNKDRHTPGGSQGSDKSKSPSGSGSYGKPPKANLGEGGLRKVSSDGRATKAASVIPRSGSGSTSKKASVKDSPGLFGKMLGFRSGSASSQEGDDGSRKFEFEW